MRKRQAAAIPSCLLLLFIVCGIIVSLTACGSSTTTSLVSQTTATTLPPTTTETPTTQVRYYSPLTGDPVDSRADLTKPVTGVMIDNLDVARPQSGVKDGEVVIEAIAESGITRFLVLYQQNKPQLVGPIRSVRPYDIDWATAFNASIAHVGGSPRALAQLRSGNYRNIDQFANGSYYWRARDRKAPHNVYTSFTKLDALNKKKGYLTSSPGEFLRVDGHPVANPNATSVSIVISARAAYNSTFSYDEATNTYARYQGGTRFVDREKGPVSPVVVVTMMVDEKTVDEKGAAREQITTVGRGTAHIFQNGTVVAATWSKASVSSQIMFIDAAGMDIPLVRGQTWIVAVPNSIGSVTWK